MTMLRYRNPRTLFAVSANAENTENSLQPRRLGYNAAGLFALAFVGMTSTAASAGFQRDMTAGKGYLALAALIFGKWRPYPTLGACLLFAFTDALAARLQGVALPLVGVIPVQFILALPYALTVMLLAGFVGKSVAPRAIGVPYAKEK